MNKKNEEKPFEMWFFLTMAFVFVVFTVVILGVFSLGPQRLPKNQFGNAPQECSRQYHSLSPEEKAWWNGSEEYINACVQ